LGSKHGDKLVRLPNEDRFVVANNADRYGMVCAVAMADHDYSAASPPHGLAYVRLSKPYLPSIESGGVYVRGDQLWVTPLRWQNANQETVGFVPNIEIRNGDSIENGSDKYNGSPCIAIDGLPFPVADGEKFAVAAMRVFRQDDDSLGYQIWWEIYEQNNLPSDINVVELQMESATIVGWIWRFVAARITKSGCVLAVERYGVKTDWTSTSVGFTD
jgi:hypothetical protein